MDPTTLDAQTIRSIFQAHSVALSSRVIALVSAALLFGAVLLVAAGDPRQPVANLVDEPGNPLAIHLADVVAAAQDLGEAGQAVLAGGQLVHDLLAVAEQLQQGVRLAGVDQRHLAFGEPVQLRDELSLSLQQSDEAVGGYVRVGFRHW